MPRQWHSAPSDNKQPPDDDTPPQVRPDELAPRHSPSHFKFESLCQLMNAIRLTQGIDKKKNKLERFFSSWRRNEGFNLYPIIRLLIPERDRDRPVYYLKESKLAKVYNEVLGLDPKKHEDAARLVKWKQPVLGRYNEPRTAMDVSGDFPMVLRDILIRKSEGKDDYTVDQVNEKLDELARNSRNGDKVLAIFKDLNQHLSPDSQSWLVRIILQDLKLTMKEKSILEVFHPNAKDLFIVSSDLKKVCWELWDPEKSKAADSIGIGIFSAFEPMRANSRKTFKEAVKVMDGPFIIEEKLDGERIQLHKKGGKFRYWSRRSKDYTYIYGKDATEGALTPFIANQFREDVDDCILDGEMLAYDPELDKLLPFGTLKTAGLSNDPDPTAPHVVFKIFDILYLRLKHQTNGISLAHSGKFPLTARKLLLEGGTDKMGRKIDAVVKRVEYRFDFPFRREGCTEPKQVEDALYEIMKRRGEGLILKQEKSAYYPGDRRDEWLKIKPDFFDELGENADLLVLGGWYGQGHRGGKIASFLLGLKIEGELDKNGDPMYATLCKVGTGLKMQDYDWMKKYHSSHWNNFDRNKPSSWPTCIQFAKNGKEDKPDIWIHPDNSFVLEVKASEVVESTEFALGQTLRFPRCKFLRYDLASQRRIKEERPDARVDLEEPNHHTTIDWAQIQKRSRSRRIGDAAPKKKKKATEKKQKMLEGFAGFDTSKVQVVNDLFVNFTAHVSTDHSPDVKIKHLQEMFHKHGGKFKQSANPTTDGSTLLIFADKEVPAVKTFMRSGKNVIRSEWILDCVKTKSIVPFFKKYYLFATDETQQRQAYNADPNLYDYSAALSESEDEDEDNRGRKVAPELGEAVGRADMFENNASDLGSHTEASDDDWEHDLERLDTKDEELHDAMSDTDSALYVQMADNDDAGGPESQYLKNMVFYLDTLENWRMNGLSELETTQERSDELASFEGKLTSHGGRVTTNLRDSKLTHIIMCLEVEYDRYTELQDETREMKGDGFGRFRQIVTVNWLKETFEEDTPVPESEHRPW